MSSCCHSEKKKDYLLLGSIAIIVISYVISITSDDIFVRSVYDLVNKMWWGVSLGIIFVGLLGFVPRETISSVLGKGGSVGGIARAVLAGVLLDLCSHGILLVGMKLYERGASLGQTMAFLIASPWNSISLTLLLWALIGFKWMMIFLLMSMCIAFISGLLFELFVKKGVLPENPNTPEFQKFSFPRINFSFRGVCDVFTNGLKDSSMILRWIFLGIILASLVRTFISPDQFETYFGATFAGLSLTIFVATVIEVCSEGSTPIAADILTYANAPGNSFAFLMSGVATDYTEIISLKETTKSWKIALFLPLVTLPQVVLIAMILNS